MFPSAGGVSDNQSVGPSTVDWLTNRSFNPPPVTVTIEDDGNDQVEEVKLSSESLSSASPSSPTVRKKPSKIRDPKRRESKYDSPHRRERRSHRSSHKSIKKSRRRSSSRHSKQRHKEKAKKSHQESDIQRNSSKKVFLEETGLPPEKAFRLDNQPDRNNLAFDSIYYLLLPKYDQKKCVKSRHLRKLFSKKKTEKRYFSPKSLGEPEKVNYLEGVHDMSNVSIGVNRTQRPTLKEFGSRLETIYDSSTTAYTRGKDISYQNSISGSTATKDDTDLYLAPESSEENEEVSKTEYFNKHLRENPHDIDSWLNFIDFQDEYSIWDFSQSSKKLQDVALGEKKLSIVDKAIELNSTCIALKLKRLEVLRNISTPEDLEKEWKKLSFVHPNNPKIWKSYFKFLTTHVTHFTVSKTTKVYQKCLEIFKSMLEGTFHTHTPPPNLEVECLNFILDFTKFLSISGFIEKSIAIWQALVEFNLFAPENFSKELPLSDMITLFEPFWDSGCPRFGEKNSLGWNKMSQMQSLSLASGNILNIDELEDAVIFNEKNNAKIWYQIEDLRETYYWFPIKIHEYDQTDDIERSVSFEDISAYLFRFQEPETNYQIIKYFLQYLKSLNSNESSISRKISDALNVELLRNYNDYNNFFSEVYHQSIQLCLKNFPVHAEPLVLERLKLLIHAKNFDYKSVKKTIKEYLKFDEFRSSLEIWNLLVQLELDKGSPNLAETIYETAISTFAGKISSRSLIQFIVNYADLLLGLRSFSSIDISFKGIDSGASEKDDRILKAIASCVIGKKLEVLSPTIILKVQRILATMAEIQDEYLTAVQTALLLSYFLSKDIEQAMGKCAELLENSELEPSEKVFEICAKIYCLRTIRFGGPLSNLRSLVQRAITNYPSNHSFLNLFIEIESKVAIPITIQR